MKKTSHLIYQNRVLFLALLGIGLIVLAFIINRLFAGSAGVNLLELLINTLTNIGGLILTVGVLQWMFDREAREEMIREISHNVLGSSHIYDKGISDCYDNSKELGHKPEHVELWKKAEKLIIGAYYTEAFFSDYIKVFEERCKAGRTTTVLISDPKGLGIEYLNKADTEVPNVEEIIKRIIRLLTTPPHGCTDHTKIYLHSVVLRYLFLATEEHIWIVPMLNSKGRSPVPAIQIRHDSPLYTIFNDDIQRLIIQSQKVE